MSTPRVEVTPASDAQPSPSLKISVRAGVPWLTLWLFTVGIAKLSTGSAIWALLVWPYYLGAHFTH